MGVGVEEDKLLNTFRSIEGSMAARGDIFDEEPQEEKNKSPNQTELPAEVGVS